MKTRNYVAKYAQRSGSGKHKRKDMKEYTYDDWNDAENALMTEQQYYDEMQYLEDKNASLEQILKDMCDDEVFVLAEIMLIRDHYSDYKDVHEELTAVVNMHAPETKHKAIDKLLKMYPNRHWGEF